MDIQPSIFDDDVTDRARAITDNFHSDPQELWTTIHTTVFTIMEFEQRLSDEDFKAVLEQNYCFNLDCLEADYYDDFLEVSQKTIAIPSVRHTLDWFLIPRIGANEAGRKDRLFILVLDDKRVRAKGTTPEANCYYVDEWQLKDMELALLKVDRQKRRLKNVSVLNRSVH